MTILARVVNGSFELTVCGNPSREWAEWLLTATVPLTASQIAHRDAYRAARDARAGEPSDVAFDLEDTGEI